MDSDPVVNDNSPVNDSADDNAQDTNDTNATSIPPVNDVLAQQMGTDYENVENEDKQSIQQELADQGNTTGDIDSSEGAETEIPSDGAVDDRNTSDGQMTGV